MVAMRDIGQITPAFYWLDKNSRTTYPVPDDGTGLPRVVQWARRMSDMHRIGWDDVPDMGLHVSTIFLGFDFMHEAGLHPTPLLFETAILDDEHSVEARWLTATLDDAERAHAAALAQLRAGVRPS